MKKIVVFSGAGMSAESGIKTFRDSDGLWENYDVREVATPEAWKKNPKLVLEFYNQRRKQVLKAFPNEAHKALVRLEQKFHVQILTQNIDDLHERAGSTSVLHLHGEILKARSTFDDKVYQLSSSSLTLKDKCSNNHQLRPDVVWFGEPVPNMIKAATLCKDADLLIVVGTSLSVYPAANIIDFVPQQCKKYLIDPQIPTVFIQDNFIFIEAKASEGVVKLVDDLLC